MIKRQVKPIKQVRFELVWETIGGKKGAADNVEVYHTGQ